MVNHLFPVARSAADHSAAGWDEEAERIRRENGFDPVQHEQLREDLQRGRIGLARNRLPVDIDVRDVEDSDLIPAVGPWTAASVRPTNSTLPSSTSTDESETTGRAGWPGATVTVLSHPATR